MKILAFDGTAKIATVAVCEDEHLLAQFTVDNGLTQSELLLPMAEDMLKALKLDFNDIDMFAVAVGPGSFTGVRIGVSLVKGLAFGRGVPCVEVSTLEAMAYNLRGLGDAVCIPCMDARRGQFYCATFSLTESTISAQRIDEDDARSLDQITELVDNMTAERFYVCGDGREKVYKHLAMKRIPVCPLPDLLAEANAAGVAAAALHKFRRGEFVSDTVLSPVYLRLPQAERERLEREAAEKRS